MGDGEEDFLEFCVLGVETMHGFKDVGIWGSRMQDGWECFLASGALALLLVLVMSKIFLPFLSDEKMDGI